MPLLAVAACASPADSAGPAAATAPASAADEAALIEQYDAIISAFPTLAIRLATIRDQHAAHLAALGGAPAAPGTPVPSAVPRTAQEAVTALTAAEKAASVMRLEDCVAATDPQQARTLALIAASEASHVAEMAGP